jgi:RNA methyltransferase, TrmH family
MNFIEIDDIKCPQLEVYRLLRDKAISHDNSFIADSPKVVNLLLQSDIEIHSILATRAYYEEFEYLLKEKNIPKLFVTSKEQMQNIVGHKIHHNCMMHGVRPNQTNLEDLDDQIIMLDEITSTENIGSIARSAVAMGINSYVLPTHGPHPFGRRSLRVSMGYMHRLKTHLYDDIFTTLKTFQALGYTIFAAELADDAVMLSDVNLPEKWVLLMGHEGKGISKEVLDACDVCVQIEMAEDVKSFNVGVAASIMMYQFKHN